MSILSIVALILVAALIGWMGVACWREEQEQKHIDAIIDRLEREPAYLETVRDRLEKERRHGR